MTQVHDLARTQKPPQRNRFSSHTRIKLDSSYMNFSSYFFRLFMLLKYVHAPNQKNDENFVYTESSYITLQNSFPILVVYFNFIFFWEFELVRSQVAFFFRRKVIFHFVRLQFVDSNETHLFRRMIRATREIFYLYPELVIELSTFGSYFPFVCIFFCTGLRLNYLIASCVMGK